MKPKILNPNCVKIMVRQFWIRHQFGRIYRQAADISIGNRTPCICLTHLNIIKNLEVHKSSVMWEKQTSSEGNCWIHLLRLFRKKRVDRNNLSSLIISYQSGTKCGVGSHRTCSHFSWLIARILTIFDKKYHI